MSSQHPQIEAVEFEHPDFAGALDIRRWRAGERNTRLARSRVHGFGSFAVRPIFRGEAVLVQEPRSGNFPVNHCDSPNAARAGNRAGLFALRDIAKGEEITEDYRFLPFFRQAVPLIPEQLIAAPPAEYRAFMIRHGFAAICRASAPHQYGRRG